MIAHQSKYGQVIMFSPKLYFSISDEKLDEIEQNCANIDREVITIGDSSVESETTIVTDIDKDLNIEL